MSCTAPRGHGGLERLIDLEDLAEETASYKSAGAVADWLKKVRQCNEAKWVIQSCDEHFSKICDRGKTICAAQHGQRSSRLESEQSTNQQSSSATRRVLEIGNPMARSRS